MKVKKVSKRQAQLDQYNEWISSHKEAYEQNVARIKKRLEVLEKKKPQAVVTTVNLAPEKRELPEPGASAKIDILKTLDPEQREEYLRREKAAQEATLLLKSRVAPAYNKGGYTLWTDGMLEDIKSGGHRRR
jgi:predicted phage gp36 major capsid-like protein